MGRRHGCRHAELQEARRGGRVNELESRGAIGALSTAQRLLYEAFFCPQIAVDFGRKKTISSISPVKEPSFEIAFIGTSLRPMFGATAVPKAHKHSHSEHAGGLTKGRNAIVFTHHGLARHCPASGMHTDIHRPPIGAGSTGACSGLGVPSSTIRTPPEHQPKRPQKRSDCTTAG